MADLLLPPKLIDKRLRKMHSPTMKPKHRQINAPKTTDSESSKISEVCKEFESLFLNYLLKEMRAAIPKSGLWDGGEAEQIYTAMFDEKLSSELAQHGGIGLAQIIRKSLMETQNNNENR
jgi:peptidoglycan hydrolase FlgJ